MIQFELRRKEIAGEGLPDMIHDVLKSLYLYIWSSMYESQGVEYEVSTVQVESSGFPPKY